MADKKVSVAGQYCRWSYNPAHNRYTGVGQSIDTIPSGVYDFVLDNLGNPIAIWQDQRSDNFCDFEFGPLASVQSEIDKFWNSAERYAALGVTHKRGILLYGPPGCGKSFIINNAITKVIERGGVACRVSTVDNFTKAIPLFRQIEGSRPILAIIEDIDNTCQYQEEELLEALDGATTLGNGLLWLATTNFIKEVPARVRCRPSRIDTLLYVGYPEEKQRLEYLKFLCSEQLRLPNGTLRSIAEATDKFSLAGLKEVFLSIVIYEKSVEEAIGCVRKLLKEEIPSNSEDENEDEN